MNLKQFLLWLPMIPIAILNGGIREGVWNTLFTQLTAHQISTVSLMLLCAVYIGLIFRFLELQSAKQALVMGFLWALLTVGFEFVFGWTTGNTMQELFYDYNLVEGRLWTVFLFSLFILPYIFYEIKNK